MFNPEYMRAEYQQKRRSRLQRFRKVGIPLFIAAQFLFSFWLVYVIVT